MKRIHIILAIVILVVAGILVLLGAYKAHAAQKGLMGLFFFHESKPPVAEAVTPPSTEPLTLAQLEAENKKLKMELRELRVHNQHLSNIEAENIKLRKALDYRDRTSYSLKAARIIARDASTWWNVVTLDCGFEQGVEADMPVLSEDGLVGKTMTVAKNETKVLLLTDESCKVAATIEGSPEKGIVSGLRETTQDNSGHLQMTFLPKDANLKSGQKVYSAGVRGALFPAGIFLGTINDFNVRALDGQAILSPAVDVNVIEDVFILLKAKK